METVSYIKMTFIASVGFLLGYATEALGGYDNFLRTLIVMMFVDIMTGWIVALYRKTKKAEGGPIGINGLLKKGCMLLVVTVAVVLDSLLDTHGLTRDAVIIAFMLNELVSILENIGQVGVKMPEALTNALEMLHKNNKK